MPKTLYGGNIATTINVNNPVNDPVNTFEADTRMKPLGSGMERIRAKQGRITGLDGPSSFVYGATIYSPVNTTLRTIGMPLSSNHNFVSYLTTAAPLQVASTNANDTSAGTGCRQLFISGLDNNWDIISETISMNGQTPVITSTSFLRVNLLFVVEVGSEGRNLGDVYVSSGDTFTAGIPNTQTLYAMVRSRSADIVQNTSMMGLYSVPRNQRFWLNVGNYYWDATQSKVITFREDYIAPYGVGGQRIRYTSGRLQFSASVSFTFNNGGAFDEKTDYEVRAVASSGLLYGTTYYEKQLEDISTLTI